MTTVSVPMTEKLMHRLNKLTKRSGMSRSAIMREALERYAEDEVVDEILRAQREPTLRGELDELAKQFA